MNAIELPEVLEALLLDQYLDEASSTTLAISEAFDGFSTLYSASRFALNYFY